MLETLPIPKNLSVLSNHSCYFEIRKFLSYCCYLSFIQNHTFNTTFSFNNLHVFFSQPMIHDNKFFIFIWTIQRKLIFDGSEKRQNTNQIQKVSSKMNPWATVSIRVGMTTKSKGHMMLFSIFQWNGMEWSLFWPKCLLSEFTVEFWCCYALK